MRKLLAPVLVGFLALSSIVGFAQPPHPLDTLKTFRAQYPAHMEPAQLGELLNKVAWVHKDSPWRLGLLRKDGGSRCPAPQGVTTSCDILISQSTGNHYDVLIGQDDPGDNATPVWRDVGPCVPGPSSGCDMARFLAPVEPTNPTPDPEPPPVPTPDLSAIIERLNQLEQQNRFDEARHALIGEVLAGLHEQTADMQQRVAAVESRLNNLPPVPVRCRATVLGVRVSCQLEFK